jgi:site-specific DNA recombinase
MESCWANNRPAYRCRHGYSSAVTPDPVRPKNAYIREDRILPHLPALHGYLTAATPTAGRRRRRTRQEVEVVRPVSGQDVISYLRAHEVTLTYDPQTGTLHADGPRAVTLTTVISRAS